MAALSCSHKRTLEVPPERIRAATFDYYWGVLDRKYPFFEQLGIDWEDVKRRHRARVVGSTDVLEYYRNLALMLSELKDPHCKLESGLFPSDGSSSPKGFTRADVGVVKVEKKDYVWLMGDIEGCVPFLRRDFPLLGGVNGVDIGPILDSGREIRSGDQYGLDLECANGLREHFAMTSRVIDPADEPARQIGGERLRYNFLAGTPLELQESSSVLLTGALRDGGLATSWDSIHPFYAPKKYETQFRLKEPRRVILDETFINLYWWRYAKRLAGVGYLRLSTFKPNIGGNISLRDIGGAVRSMLSDLSGCEKLVIDLRYNSGGRSDALAGALQPFIREPFCRSLTRFNLRDLSNPPVSLNIFPSREPFQGRIAVLVNGYTASCAEAFAMILREHCGALLVGETTCGAEAGVGNYCGPDGSKLSFGMGRIAIDGEHSYQTCGLTPDINVPLTIGRVREIGYADAVLENEIAQFAAACEALGVDGYHALGIARP